MNDNGAVLFDENGSPFLDTEFDFNRIIKLADMEIKEDMAGWWLFRRKVYRVTHLPTGISRHSGNAEWAVSLCIWAALNSG